MKTRSIDAQLWKETVQMLEELITYAELMVRPTQSKEKFLDDARAAWKKAKQADQQEPG